MVYGGGGVVGGGSSSSSMSWSTKNGVVALERMEMRESS